MSDPLKIRNPVREEMDQFEAYFGRMMKSNIPFLKIILNYVFRRKGKQMRPMLVFLTAKLNGGTGEAAFTAATLIELLHTASLVHDDVVDDASERRGALSVNALWNSKIAVLVGDYMLAKGLLISIEKNHTDMLEITAEAVKSMTEAELLQIQKSRKLNLGEDDYFRIIKGKTAALISACTACGARAATDNPDTIQLMKDFGETLGIAFQIRDDILDYNGNGLTGKKTGNDIKEKKITLPLIRALEKASIAQKRHILRIIGNKKKSRQEIDEVIRFVSEKGGLEYASERMYQYHDKAQAILDTYPPSETREALREFVNYTVTREK